MNKNQKLIAGGFYLIGLLSVLFQASSSEINYTLLYFGATLLFIPWIMCLISAWKLKNNNALWVFFIFFFGALAIPLFLLTVRAKTETMPANS